MSAADPAVYFVRLLIQMEGHEQRFVAGPFTMARARLFMDGTVHGAIAAGGGRARASGEVVSASQAFTLEAAALADAPYDRPAPTRNRDTDA